MTTFKKYLLISLIIASLNAVILLVFFVPRFNHTDTQEYISTIEYIAGKQEAELVVYRLLKPFPIFISVALSPFLNAKDALIFQNLIFYLLSVWLIYLLVYKLYKNEKQAFYGTLLYIGAYPMLAYGLAALTDLSGWFFYLLSILISLRLVKTPRIKTAFLAGFIAGLGMLFKENLGAAPIFFVSLVFIATNLPIKEKLKYIIIFGISFTILPLINNLILYKFYSYSYLHWFLQNWHSGLAYTALRIFIETARVFLLGWLFVFWGICKEFATKDNERTKILLALLPSSLSFFLWAFPHNRIMFIAAPLLVLLGSFGLLRRYKNSKINKTVELALLFLYLLVNYAILEFLLGYGVFLQDKF